MAPRFHRNMYQTYKKDKGSDALICFSFSNDASIFLFRDKLTEMILEGNDFFVTKDEGDPTPVDSRFVIYANQHEQVVKDFLNGKHPGNFRLSLILDWIFCTQRWKEFKKERQNFFKLAAFELMTSHDHSCIEVYSSLHSEDSLSELIESVAAELDIDMPKNRDLGSMASIIMSNRSFDLAVDPLAFQRPDMTKTSTIPGTDQKWRTLYESLSTEELVELVADGEFPHDNLVKNILMERGQQKAIERLEKSEEELEDDETW